MRRAVTTADVGRPETGKQPSRRTAVTQVSTIGGLYNAIINPSTKWGQSPFNTQFSLMFNSLRASEPATLAIVFEKNDDEIEALVRVISSHDGLYPYIADSLDLNGRMNAALTKGDKTCEPLEAQPHIPSLCSCCTTNQHVSGG